MLTTWLTCAVCCHIAAEVFLVDVWVIVCEMKTPFLPSFFSSSQHHVANSFLIPPHNLPMEQNILCLWLSSSCLPSCHSRKHFATTIHHHHSFAFSPVDIFLMYAFFPFPFAILLASLEAANVMRYHCECWKESERSERDIKMLSSHSLMPLRSSAVVQLDIILF